MKLSINMSMTLKISARTFALEKAALSMLMKLTPGVNFIIILMCSFYARRFQKHKMTVKSSLEKSWPTCCAASADLHFTLCAQVWWNCALMIFISKLFLVHRTRVSLLLSPDDIDFGRRNDSRQQRWKFDVHKAASHSTDHTKWNTWRMLWIGTRLVTFSIGLRS